MNKPTPLNGITNRDVVTERITQNVYFSGDESGIPVIFLHGNLSAALYWEESMLALPAAYRGIAPDLRGYGWTEDKLIDSTRGMRDLSDDVKALMDTLHIEKAHFVAWSMGAGVVYRLIADYSERILSATLVCPVSPFGFGGSKSADGEPCYTDFAGSGGGIVNPTLINLIKVGDRSTDDPNSPRSVINTFYYKPPFVAAREEDFLTAALAEKIGEDRYPGDFLPSENWPNVAPGKLGPVNCWSPKYCGEDVPDLLAAKNKPPMLWIRGDADMIVSDTSMFDFGTLGSLGYVPGWPGNDVYPPQPMLLQTRFVFEKYAQTGGSYIEHVVADAAHGVHIEKPEEFNQLFHAFLKKQ
ncbi:MAG: alpha/beta hydrolase [Anaerolineaceae bacterium]|nr:alpha/beta hydrolase [Anaerolineaceae bacterium]